MKRKGQLWISAVLYIALGVVAITLVLTAGLPLINKMKDRNTVIQAKEMMNTIDSAITDVRKEGVGSKRYLSPVIIKGGELKIDPTNEELRWKLRTKAVMVEPCTLEDFQDDAKMMEWCAGKKLVLKEGNLNYFETKTIVKNEYDVRVELNYIGKINLKTENPNPLTGKYSFSIENTGSSTQNDIVVTNIEITVT